MDDDFCTMILRTLNSWKVALHPPSGSSARAASRQLYMARVESLLGRPPGDQEAARQSDSSPVGCSHCSSQPAAGQGGSTGTE